MEFEVIRQKISMYRFLEIPVYPLQIDMKKNCVFVFEAASLRCPHIRHHVTQNGFATTTWSFKKNSFPFPYRRDRRKNFTQVQPFSAKINV
jgi:hypothetical protein